MARFDDEKALVQALAAMAALGVRDVDAATAYPTRAVEAALGAPRTRIPWAPFTVAAGAGLAAWLVMWWTNAHDMPLDVGGRPVSSFWTDVPIIFETMILSSGSFAFLAFFLCSGLPRLHHAWFEANDLSSGFWLAIPIRTSEGDVNVVARLRACGALAIEVTS
jgi:hypothetical protein